MKNQALKEKRMKRKGMLQKYEKSRKTRVAHVGEGLVPSRRNQVHIAKKCSADSHYVRNRRTFLLANIFARRAAARAAPTARPSFLQLRCIFATRPFCFTGFTDNRDRGHNTFQVWKACTGDRSSCPAQNALPAARKCWCALRSAVR